MPVMRCHGLARLLPAFLFLTCALQPSQAQEASKECPGGRILKIRSEADKLKQSPQPEDEEQPLHYSISNPRGVRAAWVEVWDRPKRLSRHLVQTKTEGEIPCFGCNHTEETPAELHLSIYDPAIPIVCYENCKGNGRGAYVSEVAAGRKPEENPGSAGSIPDYLLEEPQLVGPPVRFEEGAGATDVIFFGANLIPTTRVYLTDGEDAWQKGNDALSYLPSKTLDLRHIRATIPKEFLAKPGILEASAEDKANPFPSKRSHPPEVKIIVVSKDSPRLNSIEPPELRADAAEGSEDHKAAVVLRGSGFTKDSDIAFGYDPTSMSSLMADVNFVSPTELRAQIPAHELKDFSGVSLRLSVFNDNLHFSEPRALHVLPTAKAKPEPLPAFIRSISPYPVPMMDYRSPAFLPILIGGDNFRPGDVVTLRYTFHERTRLRTQYISPHQLKAWLPRELWRIHKLSFRIVIQTAAGLCYAEAFANAAE
jgi:hypothetical protein